MELQDIVPCDPPAIMQTRSTGPTLPVDTAILAFLRSAGPAELREITAAVGDSTHHVFARVAVMRDKGLLVRVPRFGAPSRGPGASVYQLAAS